MRSRYVDQSDPGSAASVATFMAAASSPTGPPTAHGVLNPAAGALASQRIGVRIRSSGFVPVMPISSP